MADRSCSFEMCGKPVHALDLCQGHYRQHKAGEALKPLRGWGRERAGCIFDGCTRQAYGSFGFCQAHNVQFRTGGSGALKPLRPHYKTLGCSFPECEHSHWAKGYCRSHYAQFIKRGSDGLRSAGSRGRIAPPAVRPVYRRVTKDGYVAVSGGKYGPSKLLEHRTVMEAHIGRALLPGENVHHINGDRLDNRLGNLELWSTRQPKGQRVADKLAWAREIVALYGPLEANGLI